MIDFPTREELREMPYITADTLRSIRAAYETLPLQVAQSLNGAAVELERLTREVAVRDRALGIACEDQAPRFVRGPDRCERYMAQARAELAEEAETDA